MKNTIISQLIIIASVFFVNTMDVKAATEIAPGVSQPIQCSDLGNLPQEIFNLLLIVGGVMTLLLGGVDIAKAVIASDQTAIKKSYKSLMTRIIALAILFLLPQLVEMILNIGGIDIFENGIPGICLE